MIRRSACNLGRYHANRAVELHEQSRKLGPTEWGLTAIWRCGNFVSAMSLLGQTEPPSFVAGMAALASIANAGEASRASPQTVVRAICRTRGGDEYLFQWLTMDSIEGAGSRGRSRCWG